MKNCARLILLLSLAAALGACAGRQKKPKASWQIVEEGDRHSIIKYAPSRAGGPVN